MICAGVLSGLLGIGSGALKIVAMDQTMRVPLKLSGTTGSYKGQASSEFLARTPLLDRGPGS